MNSNPNFTQSFSSETEFTSGWEPIRVGIAALNECPVNLWFSSQKSSNSSASFLLKMFFVRFFPDLSAKTGLDCEKLSVFSANFLSLASAAVGLVLESEIVYKSNIFPSNLKFYCRARISGYHLFLKIARFAKALLYQDQNISRKWVEFPPFCRK